MSMIFVAGAFWEAVRSVPLESSGATKMGDNSPSISSSLSDEFSLSEECWSGVFGMEAMAVAVAAGRGLFASQTCSDCAKLAGKVKPSSLNSVAILYCNARSVDCWK